MSERILIVEDDPAMVDIVRQICQDQGFETESRGDGESGLQRALEGGHALVICDLSLPRLGGMEVCTRLRNADAYVPILILTSRDDEVTKVVALNLGADDYVTKPFSVHELAARVRSLLRRSRMMFERKAAQEPISLFVFGGLELDLLTRRVRLDGQELELTALEFDLLSYLVHRPGCPVTREELMHEIWGYQSGNFDSTITAQMSRLRRKLEPDSDEPTFIETVRGVGYRFTDRFGDGRQRQAARV